MAVLDFFAAHPVFTREEFLTFLAGRGATSAETANSHPRRFRAAGRSTLERTLVDVLDRPDLAGGLEEGWRSLGGVRLVAF